MQPSAILCAFFTPLMVLGAQEPPSDAPNKVPSDFARFVAVGDGGHFDTAITTYKKGPVELVLFAAVHIADQACYATLNDRFTTCDALLYELVGPADYRPTKDREEGFNPLSMLQHGIKNSMELTFQLDEIDYSPANFVHADMTPEEFQDSMDERGETILSIMLNMMMSGMKLQQEQAENPDATPPPQLDLVKAFRSGEGRHQLRMVFASQLEAIETLAVGGEKGSTLLEGRNEKCLQVLQREMEAGKRKLGIYYGAAHLPHMERRLVEDLGFQKTGHEWLVAWDCTKRPDAKYDRALVKLRQQCKSELQTLAAAARAFRRAQDAPAVPTVRELAAERDQRWYTGPVQDPWGRDYVVRKRPTGLRWEVMSAGQDGAAGTADDLVAQEPRGK
ncbi:MAG TPA: type II secretion system protein GspG [Planctomycetota bacterium]|nr:type II secretion system protein GspG [Planctomycetota bacterium]